MKVNGRVIDKPNEVLLVLPRTDGDLAFKFRAVVDDAEFDRLCPIPQPPKVKKTGQAVSYNTSDPDYLKAVDEYATRQTNWQFLTSIRGTDGLEWETVDYMQPQTWGNWKDELKNSGFSIGEMNALWAHFVLANSLTSGVIDEARNRFLSGLREAEAEAANLLSQTEEVSTSKSGELANDSESTPQV